jgi:hypothetical protein
LLKVADIASGQAILKGRGDRRADDCGWKEDG